MTLWSVTVEVNGEDVLTIDGESVAGKESFTPEEEAAIREAGLQLLAFIGQE